MLAIALLSVVTPSFFIKTKRRTALVTRNPMELKTATKTMTIPRTKNALETFLGPEGISSSYFMLDGLRAL